MSVLHAGISMSLNGRIAGANDRPGNPLGDGGGRLHEWFFGPQEPADVDVAGEALARSGAVVLGRRMFDHGEEPWGDDGAFGMPAFVVTHREREPLVKGPTTFTFVTDGLGSAIEEARAAAGGRDVLVAGGGQIVTQCVRAGLLDELRLDLVPIVLDGGVPLFEGAGLDGVVLDPIEVVGSPAVTHVRYRVRR